ncbi:hypothetical protein PTKIN_Ptkin09bG0054600 [Pterospermum kingtungense]
MNSFTPFRHIEAANDRSYKCVFQEDDKQGMVGVTLSKDHIVAAGEALKKNITKLGPLVLPVSEELGFVATSVARKLFKNKLKPYIPDLKLAFEHFCIHPGGRAVLDELQKSLELTDYHVEPSRMTLYRFGYTASSSLWYEAYLEPKGRVNKGDRLWQIRLGSGFKCSSAVWRATRMISPAMEKNPWTDETEEFPVHVPKIEPCSLVELSYKPITSSAIQKIFRQQKNLTPVCHTLPNPVTAEFAPNVLTPCPF